MYSYIRKLSKAKAALYPNRPFHRVPGYYDLSNEILSWRTKSPISSWFTDLISSRETPLLEVDKAGAHFVSLLEEPDILALKFEMTFGDLFRKHYESEWNTSHSPEMQRSIDKDLSTVDHLIRVSQRNRSYILYTLI